MFTVSTLPTVAIENKMHVISHCNTHIFSHKSPFFFETIWCTTLSTKELLSRIFCVKNNTHERTHFPTFPISLTLPWSLLNSPTFPGFSVVTLKKLENIPENYQHVHKLNQMKLLTSKDVTEPANIRIRQMRISCAKSIGCEFVKQLSSCKRTSCEQLK